MNEDRINALRFAVELMSDETGGYSDEEKYRHKQTLLAMLAEEEKAASDGG